MKNRSIEQLSYVTTEAVHARAGVQPFEENSDSVTVGAKSAWRVAKDAYEGVYIRRRMRGEGCTLSSGKDAYEGVPRLCLHEAMHQTEHCLHTVRDAEQCVVSPTSDRCSCGIVEVLL